MSNPFPHPAGGLTRPVAKTSSMDVAINAEAAVAAALKARCKPVPTHACLLKPTAVSRTRPLGRTGMPAKPHCKSLVAFLAQARLRRLPWSPMLTEAEARRGVTYAGSGTALRRLAAKLLAGQAVKLVTIGGSVTQGGGMLGVRWGRADACSLLKDGSRPGAMQQCFLPAAALHCQPSPLQDYLSELFRYINSTFPHG